MNENEFVTINNTHLELEVIYSAGRMKIGVR